MPKSARRRPAARLVLAAALGGCGAGREPAGPAPAAADVAAVREAARPLTGAAGDYDPLLALVGAGTRLVLLGDATHGTHEFYAERARVTQRLVTERGFTGVAIEGDWDDAARVNAYVRGGAGTADDALAAFDDFPAWMWRNAEMRDFVRWLRDHNAARPPAERVGVYGIDVQDLTGPTATVLAYLDAVDPAAAARARALYACFAPSGGDPARYAAAAAAGRSCATEARAAAAEVGRTPAAPAGDPAAAEARFVAAGAAQSVADAEAYFVASYAGSGNPWNVRDSLMAGALDAVLGHLGAAAGRPARVAVWAHNTHAGDARHTEMGDGGELNVGQLARQRYGDAALLAGFFTYTGSVYAARQWGAPGAVRAVTPALGGSFSALFHATGVPNFALVLRGGGAAADVLARPRLQRAIGVVYRPETERQSHYFSARLGRQFDAVVFFDRTGAVAPLPGAAAARAALRGGGDPGPLRDR
jgi:erythromycin esterase-like protein